MSLKEQNNISKGVQLEILYLLLLKSFQVTDYICMHVCVNLYVYIANVKIFPGFAPH